MKTILISVDGMRPDALSRIPLAQELMQKASYTLQATTVMPSVTLPCHMSMFHSVDPGRHGTTTNTYMPQVRPINGLCEVLKMNDKTCAFFYNWEELKDLSRPDSLAFATYCSGHCYGYEAANDRVTAAAISYLKQDSPDFLFLYLGYLDEAGHAHGWMSESYYEALENSWKNIGLVLDSLKEQTEEYTVIITSDHGGHDRTHGTDMQEDMTIPMFLYGKDFAAGQQIADANIKDIPPTVAALAGVVPAKEWEGKSLL